LRALWPQLTHQENLSLQISYEVLIRKSDILKHTYLTTHIFLVNNGIYKNAENKRRSWTQP
jgi:hypothetical protein